MYLGQHRIRRLIVFAVCLLAAIPVLFFSILFSGPRTIDHAHEKRRTRSAINALVGKAFANAHEANIERATLVKHWDATLAYIKVRSSRDSLLGRGLVLSSEDIRQMRGTNFTISSVIDKKGLVPSWFQLEIQSIKRFDLMNLPSGARAIWDCDREIFLLIGVCP
jgi:hypothetical protein